MIISTFTLFHVLLSVAGIGSGCIVVYGLLTGERLAGWIAIFLATTVLANEPHRVPVSSGSIFCRPNAVGAISLLVLTVAILAR
jgi:hypothetical protein